MYKTPANSLGKGVKLRNIRILALATVAAAVSLAFAGASSAIASSTTLAGSTALCKSSAHLPLCEAADQYAANTQIEATATGTISWENYNLNVQCKQSTLKAETTAASGEQLPASVSSLTFAKCTFGCTISATGLPHSGSITRTEGGNGKLNYTSGSPRFLLDCFGFLEKCEYSVPSMTVTGGTEPQLSWEAATLSLVSGGKECPATTKLSKATYALSTPKPAYVALLAYPSGTTIEAESTDLKIAYEAATYSCKKATLTAKTAASAGEPLPLSGVAFKGLECINGLGAGCQTLTSNETSGSISNESTGFWLRTPGALLTINCQGQECVFNLEGATARATSTNGETPAKLVYDEAKVSIQGNLCPTWGLISATFTVKAPKPFYLL